MPDTKQMNKAYAAELRERYLRSGDADMTDAELLALLLSYTSVWPRLGETVRELERHFGAIRYAYHARYSDLMRIEGMTRHGAILMLLIGKLVSMKGKVSPVGKRVSEYESMFSMMMCYAREEEVWAAAIDDDGVVAALERLASGDDTQVGVTIGCVMKFAAYHKAHKIIIAHSHPDAVEVEASASDMSSMRYLGSVLAKAGVTLIGQVIVSGKKAKLYEYSEYQTQ